MPAPRLAVVSTHPIQYYAPIFQHLTRAGNVQPRVFFTWSQSAGGVEDPGFGRRITWDIPLTEGYESQFVENIASRPGTDHFWGLRTPGLTRAIESWEPAAVLVFGWNSHAHLGAMRHFKGRVPVFFRGDSTLLDQRSSWRVVVRKRLLTWVYSHIDTAIAVGLNNRDYFRWCGVPEQRIDFAPHAVDTSRFADRDLEHQEQGGRLRAQLGIAPEARVLLFAGKLQWQKDPFLLLEAYRAATGSRGPAGSRAPANSEASATHLVFVGNGPLEAQMRVRAQDRPDVHFLPFHNQQAMPGVYRLGDVFVLPSRTETWGLALNEAMASGRAVIASSRAGGTRDLVTPGVNGWVFESGDLGQLTQVVTDALSCDPVRLRRLGAAARKVSERWSIGAAADGIERSVLRLLN
ncbi:MAG TPA: glycosyltransferase family 4 protein [Steroidobacteraceae bacterium]|jgi:glycosyltransferase involved in cell wall biosynthesis